MPKKSPRRGFTLIELMIAISIVAVLSSIGFASYSSSQVYARDSKRKQDLRAVATALELYYQQNRRYPCNIGSTQGSGKSNGVLTDFWINDFEYASCDPTATAAKPLNSNFINQMPHDPKGNQFSNSDTTTYGYMYQITSFCQPPYPTTVGQFYTLRTRLENKKDPDRCEVKQYKNCDDLVICRNGAGDPKNDLYIITSQ